MSSRRPLSARLHGEDSCPSSLNINIACPRADMVKVTLTGEADFFTLPDLRGALHEAIGTGRPFVVVDLDQLTFIDASTLGVLVEARLRTSAAGGTLQVQCRTRLAQRLLTTTGLDGMLNQSA